MRTPSPGSYEAEISALLVTYKWVYDLGRYFQLPPYVEIHFDATAAGWRSTGDWDGTSCTTTIESIRSLSYLVKERHGCEIMGRHVKAHCGHPGNEIANSLAFWAAEHSLEQIDGCLQCLRHGEVGRELQWAFFVFRQELRQFWKGSSLCLPHSPSTDPHLHESCGFLQKTGKAEEEPCLLNIKMTSANILTLLPGTEKQAGLIDSARQEVIMKQALDANTHILGLQETRLRRTGMRTTQHFWIFQTSADKGHGGVALLFNRVKPYATSGTTQKKDLFFQKEHFGIIAASSRWIIVKVKAPGPKGVVISLHAPQSGTAEHLIRQWWRELENAIPPAFDDWPLFVTGDFNARCDSTGYLPPGKPVKSGHQEPGNMLPPNGGPGWTMLASLLP